MRIKGYDWRRSQGTESMTYARSKKIMRGEGRYLDFVQDSQDSLNSDFDKTKGDLNDLKLANFILTGALFIFVIAVFLALFFKLRRKDDGGKVYYFE